MSVSLGMGVMRRDMHVAFPVILVEPSVVLLLSPPEGGRGGGGGGAAADVSSELGEGNEDEKVDVAERVEEEEVDGRAKGIG